MLIQGGYDISFKCKAATPMLLQVHLRPELRKRLKTPEAFRLDPPVPFFTYADSFGNICTRLVAPAGLLKLSNRFVIRDNGVPDVMPVKARQAKVEDLPNDVLVYLLGSRYCDTDKLATLAWKRFGKTKPGWPLLKAILDYTHERITFGYSHARADRTASEGHTERKGVCRDYAHLAIAFCRSMNIPARYCTGYLSDIGTPQPWPAGDFAAWFEAFVGGSWHMFDPRNNTPRIGRVLIAQGRDAADVPIVQTFGPNTLLNFKVWTDEVA